MIKRRKGVAIVDTKKGILLVSGKSKIFMLPGGGANKLESRKKAAMRELYEETRLKTKRIKYLFSYVGKPWHNHSGKEIRNHCKVFLIEALGNPKPSTEIKNIAFYNSRNNILINSGTRNIIERYFEEFKKLYGCNNLFFI